MRKLIDLKATGLAGSRLTAIRYCGGGRWLCRCACGKEKEIHGKFLRAGRTRSCGCLKDELIGKLNRTHGQSESPEYNSWHSMIVRCTDRQHRSWHRYGGRGITVCRRWSLPHGRGFENFLSDMGPRPKGTTLGRVKNDKGYCPTNCEWQTKREQCYARANSNMVRLGKRTQCVAAWCHEFGVSRSLVEGRMRRGWSFKQALTAPKRINQHA